MRPPVRTLALFLLIALFAAQDAASSLAAFPDLHLQREVRARSFIIDSRESSEGRNHAAVAQLSAAPIIDRSNVPDANRTPVAATISALTSLAH